MNKYGYLTNIPLDKAVKDYIAALEADGMKYSCERVSVADSYSRVCAGAVYAVLSSPHYNACAMDGIAVEARRTFGATETTPVLLPRGSYVWVDTGDPLPMGKDAVIMAEEIQEEEHGVRLYSAAMPWQHIRQAGEDICAGDMLMCSYTRITPAAVGALIAGGVSDVEVVRRPVVGILPTGDEVVPPTDSPAEGEVMEFNSAIFSGLIQEYGGIPRTFPIVRDDIHALRQAIRTALSECDALLVLAGTSAGRDDNTAALIAELGKVYCHGIAIKPGKPAVLGGIGNKPVLGVPGYPVSGIIVMEEIFRPVMERLTMSGPARREYSDVKLTRRLTSSLKYEEFVRARLSLSGGELYASPIARGAGVVTSFVKADCIMDIPLNSEGAEAGESVRARILNPPADLVITGSHDPIIDELADILMRRHGLRTASSHVGSTGGIAAAAKGECMAAGTHLVDAETGVYNIPYVQKAFPNGGAALFGCVFRAQGIMVKKGNPKNIHTAADLARGDVSYVNRQRGSGTRVLMDSIMKRENISPDDIRGYAREEYTHTAVAAQVALDADAGMGIYSAAKLAGLDFIPVCMEQYDLLIPEEMLLLPAVQALLEAVRSEEFRTRIERMGGYRLNTQAGRII